MKNCMGMWGGGGGLVRWEVNSQTHSPFKGYGLWCTDVI